VLVLSDQVMEGRSMRDMTLPSFKAGEVALATSGWYSEHIQLETITYRGECSAFWVHLPFVTCALHYLQYPGPNQCKIQYLCFAIHSSYSGGSISVRHPIFCAQEMGTSESETYVVELICRGAERGLRRLGL
jgi:hypothetical protein